MKKAIGFVIVSLLQFITDIYGIEIAVVIEVKGPYGIINKGANQGIKDWQILYVKRESPEGLIDVAQVKVIRTGPNHAAIEQISRKGQALLQKGDKLYEHNQITSNLVPPNNEVDRQRATSTSKGIQSEVPKDTQGLEPRQAPPSIQKVTNPQAAFQNSTNDRTTARATFQVTLTRFFQDKDPAKAREGFLQAVNQDPTYALPYYNLGVLAESDKEWDGAIKWFDEFRRLDTMSKYSVKAQNELMRLNQIRERNVTFEGRRKAEYEDAIARAKLLLKAGLYKEADAEAEAAMKIDETRWEAHALRASALSEQYLYEQAANCLNKAIEHSPTEKRTKLQQALDQIAREEQYNKLTMAATIAYEIKDFLTASSEFTKAWELFPQRSESGLAAAASLVMDGDYGLAAMILTKLKDDSNPAIVKKATEMLAKINSKSTSR